MNCEHAQNELLLHQSGELPDARKKALQSHLANCPACRQFHTDSVHLTDTARQALKSGSPSHETVVGIKRQAQTVLTELRSLPYSHESGWTPVRKLALAASIAVALGSAAWILNVMLTPAPAPEPAKAQVELPQPIQGPERDLQTGLKPGPEPVLHRPDQPDETSMAAVDERALMGRVLRDNLFEIEELRVMDRDSGMNALDRELLILYGWAI